MSIKIRWKACGEEMRSREGKILVDGTGMPPKIRVDYLYGLRTYSVGFSGRERVQGLDTAERAKAFAERHIDVWWQEREEERAKLEAECRTQEEARAAPVRRREAAIQGLQAVGVECSLTGSVCLSLDVAESLVHRLRS